MADDDAANSDRPTQPGSPERIKTLLHMSRYAMGETIPSMAQILTLDERTTRRMLDKLCADQRLARDTTGTRLVYYSPLARANMRARGLA